MQKITEKQSCSGCHACYNICPKNCISMVEDAEGFWYPVVDDSICIDCGACKSVCPVLKNISKNDVVKAYACINTDYEAKLQSSSSGVFNVLAEYILDNNGVVVGAAFDDEFNVRHICIDNKDNLKLIRKSKYLQSRISVTYKKVREYLDLGRLVLFTGTPCQVDGLLCYLGKEYENLYTQDIFCHGVPSGLVWQRYLQYQNESHNSKVCRVDFRYKKNGWESYNILLEFENGDRYECPANNDLYMKGFLKNAYLRPSCSSCHSKSLCKNSDITLADFWGVKNIVPDMYDLNGTSLVVINTSKGEKLFSNISSQFKVKEVNYDDAISFNPSAYIASKPLGQRKKIFKLIANGKFEQITKYLNETIFKKCLRKVRRILKGCVHYVQK